jgi:hypothetical protein
LTGQAQVPETIYNVRAQGYFKSSAGLIVDQISAYNLETLYSGATWNFESIVSYEGPKPAQTLLSMSFITGAKPAGSGAGAGAAGEASARQSSELEQKITAVHAAQSAALSLKQERRAQARPVSMEASRLKEFRSNAERSLSR